MLCETKRPHNTLPVSLLSALSKCQRADLPYLNVVTWLRKLAASC